MRRGRFHRWRFLAATVLCGSALSAWQGHAQAQTVELVPSAAATCLTLPPDAPDKPDYPFAAYKSEKAGRVLVDLHFTGPASRPDVEIVSSSDDDSFVRAVREHVERLRVPCLAPGKDVHLRQEYVFQREQQAVSWGRASDPRDEQRRALLKCMKHSSGQQHPDYPAAALRRGVQGRVLARVAFDTDDQAPTAEVWSQPSAAALAAAVKAWLRGYRLPCLAGETIQTDMIFVFSLDTDSFGFKPLGLLDFVANTRQFKADGLQLDTRGMACPFKIHVRYQQPLRPNVVSVPGPAVASRRPLVAWLTKAELALDERMADAVFADTAELDVPCVNVAVPPAAPK